MMVRRPSPNGGGGNLEGTFVVAPQQLILIVVVFAAMWLLLIRPQQQRAKAQTAMLDKLEAGDEIITIGGIYGTIVSLDDERVRLRVADGTEIEIVRRAVGSIVPASEIEELEAMEAEPLSPATSDPDPNAGDGE
jgi:preprotein translocase subunit YajC